jgi:hypothetical protein
MADMKNIYAFNGVAFYDAFQRAATETNDEFTVYISSAAISI